MASESPPLPPPAATATDLSAQLTSLEREEQEAEREKTDPARHDAAIAMDEQLAEAGNGAKGPLVKLDDNEENLYEGLEEPYSLDLEKKIAEVRTKHAPAPAQTRTSFEDESHTDNGVYIPEVSGPEDEPHEKLPFDELPMSDVASERMNVILNMLTKGSSRIVVVYRKGATEADTRKYTDRFDLLKDNPWALLKSLDHMRRGDVWRCTTRGNVLHHTPLAEGNIYSDPTLSKKLAEQAKAAQEQSIKKALDEVNLASKKHHFGLRLTALERFVGGLERLIRTTEEQHHAIQTLISLHTYEKHSAEMVSYLRDNIGKHDRLIRQLMRAVYATEKPEKEVEKK